MVTRISEGMVYRTLYSVYPFTWSSISTSLKDLSGAGRMEFVSGRVSTSDSALGVIA